MGSVTGSLTSNAAWGSSSIRASEKLRKNLPEKQRLQQAPFSLQLSSWLPEAAKLFVTRDVLGYVFFSGSEFRMARRCRDLGAGNPKRLGLAGSRSALAEAGLEETFWFRSGWTVPFPRTTQAQAFFLLGFPDRRKTCTIRRH
uniref:Uncharacterized protein n=1 Tax=Monodon monoceros TaxID=40151 RepID=A0A8C6CJG9_MONMO